MSLLVSPFVILAKGRPAQAQKRFSHPVPSNSILCFVRTISPVIIPPAASSQRGPLNQARFAFSVTNSRLTDKLTKWTRERCTRQAAFLLKWENATSALQCHCGGSRCFAPDTSRWLAAPWCKHAAFCSPEMNPPLDASTFVSCLFEEKKKHITKHKATFCGGWCAKNN